GKEGAAGKMRVHDAKGLIAPVFPFFEKVLFQLAAAADKMQPEARLTDEWVVRMLFEEHPTQNLGAGETFVRQKLRPVGEEMQDGARFRQSAPVLDDKDRHLAGRIEGQIIGSLIGAG